jgi:hypothetical protein
MYERKTDPLAPTKVFYRRVVDNTLRVLIILAAMLLLGTIGYHYSIYGSLPWIDSFHNASMILSGMGLVVLQEYSFTFGGKIFSSLYALFSGIIFVSSIGYILAPGIHRIFHRLHLEHGKN